MTLKHEGDYLREGSTPEEERREEEEQWGVKHGHNNRMIHNVLKCHTKTFPTKILTKNLDKKIRKNFKN